MPPAKTSAAPARKRNRKRKRRAASSDSSSSSSSSSSEDESPQVATIPITAPVKTRVVIQVDSESDSDSSSSSSSVSSGSSSSANAPTTTAEPLPKPKRRRDSHSPSPPPTTIPPLLPPPGTENAQQKEDELRARFRRFWMASVADGFRTDLEELHKEPNLTESRLALLIDSLASGADVFMSGASGGASRGLESISGLNEMEVVLEGTE